MRYNGRGVRALFRPTKVLNVIVLGDPDAGKTWLTFGGVPPVLAGTVGDMFATICVTIDEDESADAYLVIPHDFQSYREDTHHIHQIPKLARDTAHAVIYVFDATDPAAVRRADRQWVLEQRFPGVPLLFVGNKKDGGRGYKYANGRVVSDAADKRYDTLPLHEGREIARRARAQGYVECSAITGEGLEEVWDEVVRIVLRRRDYAHVKPCTLYCRCNDI